MKRLRLVLGATAATALLAAAFLVLEGGLDEAELLRSSESPSARAELGRPGTPSGVTSTVTSPPVGDLARSGVERDAAEPAAAARPDALRTAVRGTVVDRQGKPVRGARVRLGRPLWTRSGAEFFGLTRGSGEKTIWIDWSTTTDPAGRFLFPNPTPGVQHLVRAESPDGRIGESARFEIRPRDRVEVPRIVLEPGGRVSGDLLDVEGRPLGGVLVFGSGFPARTDAYGRFDLGLLPQGPVDLTLDRSDLQLTSSVRVAVFARSNVVRRLVATARETITGVVIDGRRRGVKGLTVRIENEGAGPAAAARVGTSVTDADGRFEHVVAEGGTYRVSVVGRRGTEAAAASVVAPGDVRFEVPSEPRLRVRGRSVLGGPDLILTGARLLDAPLGGPMFAPHDVHAWRGPHGSLEFEPGEERFDTVRAHALGHWFAVAPYSHEELARDVDGEVVVTFGVGATLHVAVRTASHQPVADAEVTVVSKHGDACDRTDDTGWATIQGLPDGEYSVRVLTPRGLRLRRNGVVIAEGRSATVTLEWTEEGTVAGRLLDPDGEVAEGVELSLEGTYGVLCARSGPDGRFTIEDVPAGTHSLVAILPEARWYPFFESVAVPRVQPRISLTRVTVAAGATVDASATIPWRRPGLLRVRCVDGSRSVAGRLTLIPWIGGEHGTRRDAERAKAFAVGPAGVFGLPQVAPIRYSVVVEPAGGGGARFDGGEVSVEPGGATDAIVRIGKVLPVEGRIEDAASGEAVARAKVRLVHPNGLEAARETSSDALGAFRFDAAPEGALDVIVATGHETVSRRTIVGPAAPPITIVVP